MRIESIPYYRLRIYYGIILGLLLGVTFFVVSPKWIVIGLVVLLGCYAIVKRPELIILIVFYYTSSFVDEKDIMIIDLGIRLYISDLVILAGFGIIALRWIVEEAYNLIFTPLDLPMIGFLGLALVTTVYGIHRGTTDLDWALSEIRILIYLIVFFLVTNLVRTEKQLRFLINAYFMLTLIVAIGMIVQFVMGQDVAFLPGRVEALVTNGAVMDDVTRIVSPGESLLLTGFVTIFMMMVVGGVTLSNPVRILQWFLSTLGVIMTFNRNFWIGGTIALIVSLLFITQQDRMRFIKVVAGILVVIVAALLVILASPESRARNLVFATLGRAFSLTEEENYESEESTFKWREFEYYYIVETIKAHPITGVGLGAAYRPFLQDVDPSPDDGVYMEDYTGLRRYNHNAHTWLMGKTGIPCYLLFVVTTVMSVGRSLYYFKRIEDKQFRGIVLGFALTQVGISVSAIVNSIYMQWYWIPVIGMMMGVNEIIIRNYIQFPENSL